MAEAARIRDPRSGGTANRTGRDACRRVMDNPCRQQIRSRGPILTGSVLGSRPPPALRDSALVECLCGEDDPALKIRGPTGEFPLFALQKIGNSPLLLRIGSLLFVALERALPPA